MKERRKAKRVPANLTVRWTGVTSRAGPLGGKNIPDPLQEGKIVDLSTDGCFVLTASHIPVNKLSLVTQVSKEEPIMLDMFLSEDKPLELRGQVVYRVERVGFALRFLNLALPDKQALRAFIEEQELGSLESLPFPRVEGGHEQLRLSEQKPKTSVTVTVTLNRSTTFDEHTSLTATIQVETDEFDCGSFFLACSSVLKHHGAVQ